MTVEVKRRHFTDDTASYVTLVDVTHKANKTFTVEMYSKNAEEAFFKELSAGKIFEKDEVESVEIVGTYKRVDLKVVGE